jgi:hypothetical protein
LRYLGLEYRPRLARYRPSMSGLLSCQQNCRPLTGTLQNGLAKEVLGLLLM